MELRHMDLFTLERHAHPPKSWLNEYRQGQTPDKDWKTGQVIPFPVDFMTKDPIPTPAEIRAWNQVRQERIKELKEASFSPRTSTNQVKIDYKGARFTLASDDHAGIKRIMDMINKG